MSSLGSSVNEEQMRQQLERGERLIWSGAPRRGIIFRSSDILAVPFSVMWGGFAIFWETTAVRGGAPGFFVLWGVPFVAIGLYLILGRFFYDSLRRARSLYGLTNQRALIISGIWQRSTQSMLLEGLTNINLSQSRSNRGTITFGLEPSLFNGGFAGWPGANRNTPPRFEEIEDARSVLDLIRNAQKSNAQRPE